MTLNADSVTFGPVLCGSKLLRSLMVLTLLAVATMALSCGGSGRSVEAYCEVYFKEKQAYLDKHGGLADDAEASDDALAGAFIALAGSLEAFGDIEVMFDKLADVAPEEIATDVEAVRDSLTDQKDALKDAAGNPLGALGAGLVSGLMSGGSWERVAHWTASNCGST